MKFDYILNFGKTIGTRETTLLVKRRAVKNLIAHKKDIVSFDDCCNYFRGSTQMLNDMGLIDDIHFVNDTVMKWFNDNEETSLEKLQKYLERLERQAIYNP